MSYAALLHVTISFTCFSHLRRHHTTQIELLCHMLRCFTSRYIPQFQFFREFLEETVADTYSIEWKRKAFFKFVEFFHDAKWCNDLKAKV